MVSNSNIKILNENYELLLQSVKTLKRSHDKVQKIGLKESYTFEEQESLDSLTSKFSRSSDIYTQKVLRSLWAILHEPHLPFIDFVNRAEKLEIIDSANDLLEIRDLRNQIAHEYLPDAINDLIPEVLSFTLALEQNIQATTAFLEKRKLLA